MIICPLSDERKQIADHYLNMQEYLEHISDAIMPNESQKELWLSSMCINENNHIGDRTEKLVC